MSLDLNRRRFLASGGLAALAFGLPDAADATIIGDGDEQRNMDVVRAMCETWKTSDPEKIAAYFTDDVWFRGGADRLDAEASKGKVAFIERRKGPNSIFNRTSIEMVVHDIVARGSLVIVSHQQIFKFKDPAMGVHEDWYLGCMFLRGGKIQEWNDYPLMTFSEPLEQRRKDFGRFIRA